MASRESQGLQIALILFVMVSVVLAVMTFVFYRSSEEARKTASDARGKEKTAQDNYNIEQFKVQYLHHILGAASLADAELSMVEASIAADEEMAAISEAYKQDMGTYGEGLPQEKMNYRELPGHLLMALRSKNVSNTGLAEEVAKLNTEKTTIEQSEQKRTETAQQELQKARDDLDTERTAFNTQMQRINSEKDEVLASFQKTRNDLQSRLDRAKQIDEQRNREMAQKQKTIDDQIEKISNLIDEPFEVPDGRVTWVNQGSHVVWINLGLADGLRRQTTFSIYDHEAMNVTPSRNTSEEGGSARKSDDAKGKIEVTRVLDQHLAEARIVEDSPANPILPGDQIFSPAWKPGRRVRFALVGTMDLDNDRRSDRDLVRNIITMNGGVIDAEVHEDGSIEGELTAETRYLVRGTEPTDRRELDGYSKMIGQGQDLGIEEINLSLLLDLMGYKAEVRTIGLGKNAGSTPRAAIPRQSNDGDPEFRERRPPAATSDSAF